MLNTGRRMYVPNDTPVIAPRMIVKGHGPHTNVLPTKAVSFQIEDEDLPPPRSMAGEAKLTGTSFAPLPKTGVSSRSPFLLNGNEDGMSNVAALPPPRSMRKARPDVKSQPKARTRADIHPSVWGAQVLELKAGTTSRESNTLTPVPTVGRDPKAGQPNHFIP